MKFSLILECIFYIGKRRLCPGLSNDDKAVTEKAGKKAELEPGESATGTQAEYANARDPR